MSTEASSITAGTDDNTSRSSTFQSARAYVHEDGTRIGGSTAVELFPSCNLKTLDEHTLFIILNRAVGLVFAVKEAMWEELLEKIERDRETLIKYGWESGDYDRGTRRQRFEALIDQYRK